MGNVLETPQHRSALASQDHMWLENINLLDHSQVNNAYLFLPQFDGTDAVKVFKEKNI